MAKPNSVWGKQRVTGWGVVLAVVGMTAATLAAQALPELTAATAATAEAAPAPQPLTLYGSSATADPVGVGDLLDVRVFGQPQLSSPLRVGPNGAIAPPFLSPLTVAGQTPQAIEGELTTAYDTLLVHPLVSVRLVENNSRRVSIDGAVPRPGVYSFSGRMTLLQALALAGGLDPARASPEVLLFHAPPATASTGAGGMPVYTVNSILETIDVSQFALHPDRNRLISPGDVIDVQEAHPVYISGDVMRPGTATLIPGMTLTQLISESGGLLPQADPGHVRVLRLQADGRRQTLTCNVGAAQHNRGPDLTLAADDIVLVPGSVMRMTGLELLDFFTGTERWRVEQTVANRVP